MNIVIRHGTVTAYRDYGCRCRRCRNAHAVTTGRTRAAAAAKGLAPDDPRHGTLNGYDHYGCRCPSCKAAKAVAHRRHYLASRAAIAASTGAPVRSHGPRERVTS